MINFKYDETMQLVYKYQRKLKLCSNNNYIKNNSYI